MSDDKTAPGTARTPGGAHTPKPGQAPVPSDRPPGQAHAPKPGQAPAPSAPPAWLALFEALRSRVAGFGVAEHSGEIDDLGFEPGFAHRASVPLAWLRRGWWRLSCAGQGALPTGRPLLFVAGGSSRLPYEALMIAESVAALPGLRRPCFQVADAVSAQPFWGVLLSRLGGVRACPDNVRRLLGSGRSLVLCFEAPSGQGDAARTQPLAMDAALGIAIEFGVPVIPTAVLGAAEALAPAMHLPLSLAMAVPPLPTKWAIQFGAALNLDEANAAESAPGAHEADARAMDADTTSTGAAESAPDAGGADDAARTADADTADADETAQARRLERLVAEVDAALEQALADARRRRRSAFSL